MNSVQANAKAITGALMVLLVIAVRKYWPDVAATEVQEAIRILIEFVVSGLAVWLVPNKDV